MKKRRKHSSGFNLNFNASFRQKYHIFNYYTMLSNLSCSLSLTLFLTHTVARSFFLSNTLACHEKYGNDDQVQVACSWFSSATSCMCVACACFVFFFFIFASITLAFQHKISINTIVQRRKPTKPEWVFYCAFLSIRQSSRAFFGSFFSRAFFYSLTRADAREVFTKNPN